MVILSYGLTIQQITDFFHVDLHKGHFDGKLEVARCRHNAREDLLNDARYDTLCLFIVDISALVDNGRDVSKRVTIADSNYPTHHHGEGFTRAGLAIGKDCTVISGRNIYKWGFCSVNGRTSKYMMMNTIHDSLDRIVKDVLLGCVHAKDLVKHETPLKVFALEIR